MSDPVEVQSVRRQGGRGTLVLVAAFTVVVAGLAGWGALASAPGATPAPGSAAPTGVPPTVTPPPPTAPPAAIVDVAPGEDHLAALMGWPPCDRWSGLGWSGETLGDEVRAALVEAGLDPEDARARSAGLLDARGVYGQRTRVFVGVDATAAAAAFGGTKVAVVDERAVWTDLTGADGRVGALLIRSQLPVEDEPAGGADPLTWWSVADRSGPMPWCGSMAGSGGGAAPIEPLLFVGDAGGDEVMALAVDWSACGTWSRDMRRPLPSGDRVDAVVFETEVEEGWIRLGGGTRAWLGADPRQLGASFGALIVAVGGPERDDVWTLVRLDGAHVALQWARVDTPAGRVAWLTTGSATGPGCAPRPPLR